MQTLTLIDCLFVFFPSIFRLDDLVAIASFTLIRWKVPNERLMHRSICVSIRVTCVLITHSPIVQDLRALMNGTKKSCAATAIVPAIDPQIVVAIAYHLDVSIYLTFCNCLNHAFQITTHLFPLCWFLCYRLPSLNVERAVLKRPVQNIIHSHFPLIINLKLHSHLEYWTISSITNHQ